MRPPLKADAELVIIDFIRSMVSESKARGVVVGLSGGIDSALVTKLCVEAVGAEKVINVFLPTSVTSKNDAHDVEMLAKAFGTELIVIDIDPILRCYGETIPSVERKEMCGNLMARTRMTILFHYARLMDRLVMGTGNKSELLMGYFTKFGDGAADFLPIGDLYKTEVWELARSMGIPDHIVDKTPSAGLWPGQTDETEMGMTYRELDQVLYGIEMLLPEAEIAARNGLDINLVRTIWDKHRSTVHKRKMPLIPKLGNRTIGLDWRE